MSFQITTRHDRYTKYIVRLAKACGVEAEFHNREGAFAGATRRQRPADALLHLDPNKPKGTAVDVTIVTGGLWAADKAEKEKGPKYSAGLVADQQLRFIVAGIASNGFVCAAFKQLIEGLARPLRAARKLSGNHTTDLWAALGRAYVDVMMDQACKWRDDGLLRKPSNFHVYNPEPPSYYLQRPGQAAIPSPQIGHGRIRSASSPAGNALPVRGRCAD
jgi:hypothetical protein